MTLSQSNEYSDGTGSQCSGAESSSFGDVAGLPPLLLAAAPRFRRDMELYEGSGRLNGLKSLITGGDSMIGRAIAIAYACEGADVALSYVDRPEAESSANWVLRAGGKCFLLPSDGREQATAGHIVLDAAERLAGLDIVVNTATGRQPDQDGRVGNAFGETHAIFSTDLDAMFSITREAVRQLKQGACIINLISIREFDPIDTPVDYAACRTSIDKLTLLMAQQCREQGIRINSVTRSHVQPQDKAMAGSISSPGCCTPFGDLGWPWEFIGPFVFLASPREASHVSGTVMSLADVEFPF